ncbi:MAG: hypothetical protein U0414_31395 [Polyangiaceae bacterium]
MRKPPPTAIIAAVNARRTAGLSLLLFGCAAPSADAGVERAPIPSAPSSAARPSDPAVGRAPMGIASDSSSAAPAPSAAPDARLEVSRIPEKGSPLGAADRQARMDGYTLRLHRAGSANHCDEEVGEVGRDLASDDQLSDEDLDRESKARDTTNKGNLPHPDSGTACAIFGVQRALSSALAARADARARAKTK